MAVRRAVLEVNGEPVFADELRNRSGSVEDVIDAMLIRQEARRLKLQPSGKEIDSALEAIAPRGDGTAGCRADANDAESRDEFAKRLLVDRLLERWCAAVRAPKLHEMRDYYRTHQELFRTPETIAASHIVQAKSGDRDATLEDLARLRESILAGEDFAAVARRVSDCPEQGGDLGYFPRGVMVEEFDAIAFATPPGEISQPFQTQFGWHIVWVRDRKPEGIRSFEEAMPEIREHQSRELQEREVTSKLFALRKRARIVEVG